MIYIDTPFLVDQDEFPNAPPCFRGRMSAHLVADSTEELVTYAKSMGMNPRWIQKKGTKYEHFDVTGSVLARIMADDSVFKVTNRELITIMKDKEPK